MQISEIARERIFESINNTNFKQKKFLLEEYMKLKLRLGRIPSMMDFVSNGFIDPFLFIDYAGSYYEFLTKAEKEFYALGAAERKSRQFISLEFAHGLRIHELLILREHSEKDSVSLKEFSALLSSYGVPFSMKDIEGMCNTLSSSFYTSPDQRKYGRTEYVRFDGSRLLRLPLYDALLKDIRYKQLLLDTLSYGIARARIKDDEKYTDHNLILYRKYSRKDVVCKLLNWKVNITARNIGGYIVQRSGDELLCPVFITYNKSSEISDSIKYEDYFIDNTRLNWMSKNKRTSSSPDVEAIINQRSNNIQIPLFVKKSDGEGSDFYYLGNMREMSYEDTKMDAGGKSVNVVNVQFDMEHPVPQNLYSYLEM